VKRDLAAAILCCALVVVCSARAMHAAATPDQTKRNLTIEDIIATTPVTGRAPRDFRWSPDGRRYVYDVPAPLESAPPDVRVHDVARGTDSAIRAARAGVRGSRSRPIAEIAWSPDSRSLAYVDAGTLRVASATGKDRGTFASGADDPQWSPDGRVLAFVKDGNLTLVDTRTKRVRRLTHDGSDAVLDGDPDWLYSEELDLQHGYAWSPRGDAIAYLRFDDRPVTAFPIQDYLVRDNTVERQRYPLAGERNPRVSLHVVDVAGGADRLLYDAAPRDEYIATFTWQPHAEAVVAQILDRPQRHLRLAAFSANAAAPAHTILREQSTAFVDVAPPPLFLPNGRRFVWLSERADVQSLYTIDARTGNAQRLTRGFPVSDVLGLDAKRGTAYVDARYPTQREHALLAIALEPTRGEPRIVLLTPGGGTHVVTLAPRGGGFIDRWSSLRDPPVMRRGNVDRRATTTLFATPSLARFPLGETRLLHIPSPYGPLDATVILPPNFDAQKRYPVVVEAYGGPLPSTDAIPSDDAFPGLWPHLLAEHGFIAFSIDGPASRFARTRDVQRFAPHLGEIALAGQLAGHDWLVRQPYVDPARIGLWGWSFGGYLTAYTLTHAPQAFTAGIAGAPVTDWAFYDSAYTERYMGLPKTNATAYRLNSVLPAAGALRAKLLVVQGSADDNVHLENSVQLLNAFIRNGKQVDYFLIPGARHGPTAIDARRNLQHKMLDFWETTLHP